jgi:hypothetical protein
MRKFLKLTFMDKQNWHALNFFRVLILISMLERRSMFKELIFSRLAVTQILLFAYNQSNT